MLIECRGLYGEWLAIPVDNIAYITSEEECTRINLKQSSDSWVRVRHDYREVKHKIKEATKQWSQQSTASNAENLGLKVNIASITVDEKAITELAKSVSKLITGTNT